MRAIFIAVGSELLERDRVDTNSLYVAKRLREKGMLMDMKIVVGDSLEDLAWTIKNACKRSQLVIVTGGLGPTEDDLTREAAANALKKELVFKEEIVEEIRTAFKHRGLVMPEINTRQAFIIEGARVLANSMGTAPGQYLDEDPCRLLLLPGPPREMIPMFDKLFDEEIAPLSNYHIYIRNFQFAGITESMADSMIAEIYSRYKNVRTTILASPGIISVHLMGRSRKSLQEAQAPTDELAAKIKEKMKDYIITEEDLTFEEYVVRALKMNNLTLGTAESCTGGGLSNRITDVPGSSNVFLGGVVAYSDELKMKLLGVDKGTLKKSGAVSAPTAQEMARGVRMLTGADIGIGITGIAGPAGATDNKPVGLVFMHLSSEKMEMGIHRIFPGDRSLIKTRSENFSLNLIREYINQYGSPTE